MPEKKHLLINLRKWTFLGKQEQRRPISSCNYRIREAMESRNVNKNRYNPCKRWDSQLFNYIVDNFSLHSSINSYSIFRNAKCTKLDANVNGFYKIC